MRIEITKKDIIWSYIGYFFNICTNLIIMPFTMKLVSSQELGLWYTFLSIGTLVSLLDFGFSNTLVRNITYAWSGVVGLEKEGFSELQKNKKEPNYRLVVSVLSASRWICFFIAAIALLVLVTGGTWYIQYIAQDIEQNNYTIAWIFYSLAVFCNIYYNYWISSLKGIGAIQQSQKAIILSKIVQIILSISGLLFGFGIQALALSYFASGFILRISSKYFLFQYHKLGQQIKQLQSHTSKKEIMAILVTVWHNAKKTGMVSFSSFLITQSTTLICSAFIGLEETASYGLSLQVITVLVGISATYYQTMVPMLTDLKVKREKEKLFALLSSCMTVYWMLYLLGLIGVVTIGLPILELLRADTKLPIIMVIFMGIYLFLENNHSLFATYISLSNQIPYVKASLCSGFAIATGSFIVATNTNFGIYGLMTIQFMVQLIYNNWKWPSIVLKELQTNVGAMFCCGIEELRKQLGEISRRGGSR